MSKSNRPGIIKIMNLNNYFNVYVLDIDILVTLDVIELKLSVTFVLLFFSREVSLVVYVGPSFTLCQKAGNMLDILSISIYSNRIFIFPVDFSPEISQWNCMCFISLDNLQTKLPCYIENRN